MDKAKLKKRLLALFLFMPVSLAVLVLGLFLFIFFSESPAIADAFPVTLDLLNGKLQGAFAWAFLSALFSLWFFLLFLTKERFSGKEKYLLSCLLLLNLVGGLQSLVYNYAAIVFVAAYLLLFLMIFFHMKRYFKLLPE
jgi:hypothetical protein